MKNSIGEQIENYLRLRDENLKRLSDELEEAKKEYDVKAADISSRKIEINKKAIAEIAEAVKFPFEIQDKKYTVMYSDEREGLYEKGDTILISILYVFDKTLVKPYNFSDIVFVAWCENITDGYHKWGGQRVSFDKNGDISFPTIDGGRSVIFKRIS